MHFVALPKFALSLCCSSSYYIRNCDHGAFVMNENLPNALPTGKPYSYSFALPHLVSWSSVAKLFWGISMGNLHIGGTFPLFSLSQVHYQRYKFRGGNWYLRSLSLLSALVVLPLLSFVSRILAAAVSNAVRHIGRRSGL